MIKYDNCPKCFWFDVSLNVWLTFECKEEDKEAKIQEIKKRTKGAGGGGGGGGEGKP